MGSYQQFLWIADSFLLMAVGLFFFGYVTAEKIWLLVPSIITFSLGWGVGVTTRIFMQKEYFGMVNFGTILGFLSGIVMVGTISGPPLAGWVFDTWGSYQGAWLGACAITVVVAILGFTMPSPSTTIRILDQPTNQH